MDKYEYKVRADEIKDLIARREYVQAAEIADTIDWRRVKSVIMLCTISDLYKINRRYEDARNMLLLAYERKPGGRTICYSLCELSIKMEDYVPAINYYKEFVQVAPRDPGRYILQYKLYEAQDVSLEERIGVLEELKKRDYREKWAYELAYLYHRVGLGTRCVEECDELILWFGEGKYVIKAMELKMLHQPLTPAQQEKYDNRFEGYGRASYGTQPEAAPQDTAYYESPQGAGTPEQAYYDPQGAGTPEQAYYGPQGTGTPEQAYYGPQGTGTPEQAYYDPQGAGTPEQAYYSPQEQFYYESQQGTASQEQPFYGIPQGAEPQGQFYYETQQGTEPQEQFYYVPGQEQQADYQMNTQTQIYESVTPGQFSGAGREYPSESVQEAISGQSEELDIQVKPIDMGQYNTINLQAELAAGVKEVLGDDRNAVRENGITDTAAASSMELETESLDLPEIDEVDENDLEPEAEVMEESEVFFGETGEIGDIQSAGRTFSGKGVVKEIVPEIGTGKKADAPRAGEEPVKAEFIQERPAADVVKQTGTDSAAGQLPAEDTTAETVMAQIKRESEAAEQALTAQPPKEIANVLLQESDGQISLVIPESEQIEKQITGQMNLKDVLQEWERMKQENAEKRKEEVRQHVLQHTGEMFTAFEASVRDGLLEQLEGNNANVPKPVEEENIVHSEAEDESFYEESEEELPEEEPVEEYLEESEDWTDQTREEEPEQDVILRGAEQEVILGDADEAEEMEEVPKAEEEYEADGAEQEVEEFGLEAGEEEEEPEQEVEEFELEAGEGEKAEEPEQEVEEFELEAGEEEETEEPEQKAHKAEPKASAAKKSRKSAKKEQQTDQAEEAEQADVKKKPEETDEEHPPVEREKGKVRGLTREEKELYGPYIQSRASREQLVQAIDNISMAAYTGNIVITGEEGMDTVSLAKNMIREVQMTDSNFSGKVAKISGQALNKKDVEATINQMANGALIIQKASGMDADTVKRLHKALQQESFGIIIILEDVRKAMNKFLEQYPGLAACFTARMNVEALSNGTLVAFGRKYAREREYSIDDMGILALHTRIDEMQTSDHVVTVLEVKELVDSAIKHANRKTLKHFFDLLLARRYDEEDMIILGEQDFV